MASEAFSKDLETFGFREEPAYARANGMVFCKPYVRTDLVIEVIYDSHEDSAEVKLLPSDLPPGIRGRDLVKILLSLHRPVRKYIGSASTDLSTLLKGYASLLVEQGDDILRGRVSLSSTK